MSDEEIRQILIERKRRQRRRERLHDLKETIEGIIGWISLFVICFMLAVIGG